MQGLVTPQAAQCSAPMQRASSSAGPCRPSGSRLAGASLCARKAFAGGRRLASGVSNGARCRAFFNFRQGADDAGVYGSQKREDYSSVDVEDYFNYMGMLAAEGTYDRLEAMVATGMHPADILLLMACSEDDTPKVEELLRAGADPTVKDTDGRSPLDLCTKADIKKMVEDKLATAK